MTDNEAARNGKEGSAMGCTSASGRGLTRGLIHHGMLHRPTTDLAATLTPLVSERLSRAEPVLIALPAATADRLRARLPDLPGLHTTDPAELYRHPGRMLSRYRAWIADASPGGAPVTIVAAHEPDGVDAHRATLLMHVDAAIAVALAEFDLTLVCAYPDDPATAAPVRHVHPSLLNGSIIANPDHLPAEQFLARYPLPPPTELGEPHLSYPLERPEQLSRLRQIVAGHAARAGLVADRRADFVLAITEAASNAIEHGVPPAAVCLWTTETSEICQVNDAGHATEPLAGLLPPPASQRRGRGLWMAYQLCDQFYLWPQPTTVRLQMDRDLRQREQR